jgi:hypothetical protein
MMVLGEVHFLYSHEFIDKLTLLFIFPLFLYLKNYLFNLYVKSYDPLNCNGQTDDILKISNNTIQYKIYKINLTGR